MTAPPTVPFLGLPLARLATDEFIAWTIGEACRRLAPCLVGYLNAANVNLAFEAPGAARLFRRFDCLYADGQSVVWASRHRGYPVPERVNAGDFISRFLAEAARRRLRIALIGGREGGARAFAERERAKAPDLDFVFIRPGYFDEAEGEAIAAELEAADPDLVLIGMGAPRQERFAAKHSREGRPRVWWCVGALFEYGAGGRRRAPVWMRAAGLEWLFRLALEPRRLAGRYLIGNPKFVYRVLRGSPVPASGPSEPSLP